MRSWVCVVLAACGGGGSGGGGNPLAILGSLLKKILGL